MCEEIWLPAVGYEPYAVSNLGRVMNKNGKILHLYENKHGYVYASFGSLKTARTFKKKTVHKLVADAFIGVSTLQVNHKDGNKKNNALDNLELVTPSENMKHSYRLNLRNKEGEKHHMHKLTDEQVCMIRHYCDVQNIPQRELAKKFGVNQSQISRICSWKAWVRKEKGEVLM